jgi:hypothetical protein
MPAADRSHGKPIRCPRCQDKFDTRAALDYHIEDIDCISQPEMVDEGIDEAQAITLRKWARQWLTIEQQWFIIWNIVFPGVPEPSSPYVNDNNSSSMCEFREFCQREGSTIILGHLRTSPGWRPQDEERFGHALFDNILNQALDDIYYKWWLVKRK